VRGGFFVYACNILPIAFQFLTCYNCNGGYILFGDSQPLHALVTTNDRLEGVDAAAPVEILHFLFEASEKVLTSCTTHPNVEPRG
jgi:hypothetical protein